MFNNAIHDLMKIRNCIAHANGQIDLMDQQKDVNDAIERRNANGFSNVENRISLTDDALDWSLDQFHDLTLNIRDALVQHQQVGTALCPP